MEITCDSRRLGFVSLVIIFITKETNVFFFFCGQILGSLKWPLTRNAMASHTLISLVHGN